MLQYFLRIPCCKYYQKLAGALWNCWGNQENIYCSFVHRIGVEITMHWKVGPWITKELLMFLFYATTNTSVLTRCFCICAYITKTLEDNMYKKIFYKSHTRETTLFLKTLTQLIWIVLIIGFLGIILSMNFSCSGGHIGRE